MIEGMFSIIHIVLYLLVLIAYLKSIYGSLVISFTMPYLGSSHHACPQVLFPELGLDLVEGEKGGKEEGEEHSLALSLSSWQVALGTLPFLSNFDCFDVLANVQPDLNVSRTIGCSNAVEEARWEKGG